MILFTVESVIILHLLLKAFHSWMGEILFCVGLCEKMSWNHLSLLIWGFPRLIRGFRLFGASSDYWRLPQIIWGYLRLFGASSTHLANDGNEAELSLADPHPWTQNWINWTKKGEQEQETILKHLTHQLQAYAVHLIQRNNTRYTVTYPGTDTTYCCLT